MNLLFHQGSLGDWVVSLPLVQSLIARHGPTYVVNAWSKAQLAAQLIPDAIPVSIDHQDVAQLFAAYDPAAPINLVDEDWANRWRKANLILSFLSNGTDAWADNIRRLAPQAKHYFVPPRPPGDWNQQVRDWQLQQLEIQGLDLNPLSDTIGLNVSDVSAVQESKKTKGPIVIHPGSGGASKCWPADRYESLIEKLLADGLKVMPILGEVEMERWPAHRIESWMQRFSARQISDLDMLCDILAGARAYIGNDSGPSHLAALLGVPSIVLFGPSSPQIWRPNGQAVTLLAPPEPASMQWLESRNVLAALERALTGQESM
jgi:ADP-heptose:LPS heptosyltransferase